MQDYKKSEMKKLDEHIISLAIENNQSKNIVHINLLRTFILYESLKKDLLSLSQVYTLVDVPNNKVWPLGVINEDSISQYSDYTKSPIKLDYAIRYKQFNKLDELITSSLMYSFEELIQLVGLGNNKLKEVLDIGEDYQGDLNYTSDNFFESFNENVRLNGLIYYNVIGSSNSNEFVKYKGHKVSKDLLKTLLFFYKEALISNDKYIQEKMTGLKINKLLYFLEGTHSIENNDRIFPEDFDAWPHGPAVPVVFELVKEYTFLPIDLEREIKGIEEALRGKDIYDINKVNEDKNPLLRRIFGKK